ncbi:MAG: tripartite tricarboxylate transporter permease [Candidatus Thermoplasmatota archaeon]
MIVPDHYLTYLAFALLGTLLGSLLSLIPSLHVYNVIGFVVLVYLPFAQVLEPLAMIALLIGMLTGYAFLFQAQTILLNVPDDSTVFILLPGSKYLLQKRGYEAVLLAGLGGLIGIFFIVLIIPPAMSVLAALRKLLTPEILFVVIGAVIFFILLSEWPKDFGRGKTRAQRLKDGWSSLAGGYLTFLLASLLGIIIFNTTLIPVERSFMQLSLPFIGLFAVPALLLNIISELGIPKQHITKSVDVTAEEITRGAVAGCAGGAFGAFVPAVTAGVAGLLAGHATAQKGDKPFIISLGAARIVYYVGAVILFFLPLLHLRRGWLSVSINMFFIPETQEQFLIVAAIVAICGFVAFILLLAFSRVMIKVITKYSYRKLSLAVLLAIIGLVFVIGSWQGLVITFVASAIGLIPIMFHSRRINCLAVLLVPLWLNIGGYGSAIASCLGLV